MVKLRSAVLALLLAAGAHGFGAPEKPDYSECTAIAAELEFARMEIASLEHDNELLASENKLLVNELNLPEVVSDIREYIHHVIEGDDARARVPVTRRS